MPVEGTILVTGATGQQGGALARELLARGHAVKAMTRKPESEPAKTLAGLGAKIVAGDIDDEGSLGRALGGAWGVFAVQNTWEAGVEKEEEQGKRFARVAKRLGVKHFVYSSVGSAHRKTGIPHFDNKWRVEEVVRSLRFPSFVIIRPVFFMENLTSPWFKPAIDQGNVAMGMKPTTSLQMIAVKDIGRYLAWAFENGEKLNGRAIDIAGDTKTGPEAAQIIGKVAGRQIGFFQVPIAEVRKFSDDFATMYEWFDAVGYDADIEARSKESGITPTTFAEWASGVSWK
jgi:uncharacterized protein YbjT (DUF2867 family)